MDDPLEGVFAYVEKAYIRLQAGDMLLRCMEDGTPGPIYQMTESLILAGPQSLNSLREILAETEQRKMQIQDDFQQLLRDLTKNLQNYGVHLPDNLQVLMSIVLGSDHELEALIERRFPVEEGNRQAGLRFLIESRDLVENLAARLRLLEEIEKYLQDWLWGLAYQSAHQDEKSISLWSS